MKQAIRLWQFAALLACVTFSCFEAKAQTTSPTPEQFVTQITSSPRDAFGGGISGNGRFVVIQSTGDLSTQRPGRNNADQNREIYLYDYAQRRIFQITDTQSATKPAASPTPTPTPSASPTPAPTPDPTTIAIEVSNNSPAISNDGKWIIFTSNAETPGSFNGNTDANRALLSADGNQEIWLYRIPDVADVNVADGSNIPFQDLTGGTFIRITDTPASALPQAGTTAGGTTIPPFVAFDNRDPSINDDGTVVSFVSTRNLTGVNGDGSPEVFWVNRTFNPATFVQVTDTPVDVAPNRKTFTENPNISGDGSVLAFISNANIPETGGTGNNSDFNGEIYVVRMNGSVVSSLRQITRTTAAASGSVNVLSPGRRLSRNGNFLAFESLANLSSDNANQSTPALFLYDVSSNSSASGAFKQVGPRATSGADVTRFPTFTGDNAFLVFSSLLNFKADGTAPGTATDGLNPNNRDQLFATPVPAANSFIRLTNTPSNAPDGVVMQPYASNSLGRIAFTTSLLNLVGGNADGSAEVFYLLVPTQTAEVASSANAVLFFTGASDRPVASPSPTPPAVAGLAPGMLGTARPAPSATVTFAPSAKEGCPLQSICASEFARSPALPTELNGVSVSINGGAAGLYSVSPGQINFVVPNGLAASTTGYPVVIYNGNGTIIRTTLIVQAAQPDIFTMDGNRAFVTNFATGTFEPFSATTGGQATELWILLTGAYNVTRSQVSVRIGTTDITGDNIRFAPADTGVEGRIAGSQQVVVRLPASLANAGDVPIVVTATIGGAAFTSRNDASAPRILITAAGCTNQLSATSANIASSGGATSVNVTTAGGCTWTATSNAGFITVTGGSPGNGNGTVNLTIAANPGAQRSGTVSIAGQTFTVNQAGSSTPAPSMVAAYMSRGDFDGDGRADIAVWRPDSGAWFITNSSNGQTSGAGWGGPDDLPVPADYDGDGKTDLAVWRQSSGAWFIINSSNGVRRSQGWGAPGDIPVPADYDGDGKADLAVRRPTSGAWFIINSSNNQGSGRGWGEAADIPVPGDYDGDGKADLAVWRPSAGAWLIINSSNGQGSGRVWGEAGDIPVPGKYDSDNKTDIAVYRPSSGAWFIVQSSNNQTSGAGWGGTTDIPVQADYDGDGRTDKAVWRPEAGAWFITNSSNGTTRSLGWGAPGDMPVSSAMSFK